MSADTRPADNHGPYYQPVDSTALESLLQRVEWRNMARGPVSPAGIKVHVDIKRVPFTDLPAGAASKWGINGQVGLPHNLDNAMIRLQHTADTDPNTIVLAEAHERGHVGYVEDMRANDAGTTGADFAQCDTWLTEVDAWIRAIGERVLSVNEGMFLLDCLWSYGYHYADRREWQDTQAMIAACCENPAMLRAYKPLDPPKNENGDTPAPPEPGPEVEIGEPGEGNPLGEPGDEPGQEPGEDDPQGHNAPGIPNGTKGEDTPELEDTLERWETLMQAEPMALAAAGDTEALRDYMQANGLGVALVDLPPIMEAVLGIGG